MRAFVFLAFFTGAAGLAFGQTSPLIGTWQITAEKTCFEDTQEQELSETEKELLPGFGQTRTGVARVIRFHANGTGEEGIFYVGRRRGDQMREFRYVRKGNEILLLDRKSGLLTEKLMIEEITSTTLRFHLENKECEVKTLTKIK